MTTASRAPDVHDGDGRRHQVAAVLLPTGSRVVDRVTSPSGTPRPGLRTSWDITEARAYALAILTACARAEVLDEMVAAENETVRR